MLALPKSAGTTARGIQEILTRDDRPAYRPFAAEVTNVRTLGPNFRRVTFTGAQMGWFGTYGQDQRIKILFPLADGHLTDVGADDAGIAMAGTWYERWREAPQERRCPLRTYTIRAVRPDVAEIDVDMVIHGDAGPASRWLQQAARGDRVVVVGPDARSRQYATGADWAPGTATELLLAGDETAAPAICSILEDLGADKRARAFIEVPGQGDFLDVDHGDHAQITWLGRDGAGHGEHLIPAVRSWVAAHAAVVDDARAVVGQALEDVDVDTELLWDSPVLQVQPVDSCGRGQRCGSDFYAWFAGEAGMIKTLRRMLVSEAGVCRRRVAFMGYWRQGRSESQ
ncbi:siderophore-interacting protein [Pseudactinotalea sp. Z1739]|uniref:siderophore-interacting protein n=1 Tax=Pseudactinotalea sp. Z1739 TaxID=3413028 RepID=UPI003C7D8FAF